MNNSISTDKYNFNHYFYNYPIRQGWKSCKNNKNLVGKVAKMTRNWLKKLIIGEKLCMINNIKEITTP